MASFSFSDCTAERAPPRLIRRVNKMMREVMDDRLGSLGMSYPQWATVKLVAEGAISTAGEVARELDYSTGATTRLIDGLELAGYLVRSRDRDDRRVVAVAATEQGRAIAARGKTIAVAAWNELLANLGQAEADQFVDTLVKIEARVATIHAHRAGPVREAAE